MYTEKQLNQLIEEVEREFNSALQKAETQPIESLAPQTNAAEPLIKSEEKAEDKKEDKKPEEKPEEKKEEHKEHKEEAKPAEAAEHKEAAEPAKEEEQHAAPAEGEDHCDYDDEDKEHMHKMYMSMHKGELKAHHDAVKKALDNHGMAKCGEQQMSKSETVTSIEVTPEVKPEKNPELELLKSEFEAEKAKSAELKKSLDAVNSFFTKLVEKKPAPQGKAITSLDVIAKSEASVEEKVLTKNEVTAILNQKEPSSLSKSDRDLINAFYLNGGSINSISHLLK